MGKQLVIGIVVLLVGLGGGVGIGYLIFQPTIDASLAEIDDLKAVVEKAELQSGETLKKAGEEIAKAKAESERSRSNAIRVNTELRKANLENQRLKAILAQAMEQRTGTEAASPAQKPAAQPLRQRAAAVKTTESKPATATAAATMEYTIKNGDSLWKIAANELGNGLRFEEILELNPQINKDSKLSIGMKLKLPAK